MTNSKKNSKSIIALVVMAVLLVASIVLAATGAWFTAEGATTAKPLKFGTVTIKGVTEDVVVRNTIDTTLEKLMPGSSLEGKLTVEYTGNTAAYIRYKVTVDGAGKDFVTLTLTGADADGWVYAETAASTNLVADVAGSVATTVGNDAQDADVTIKFDVEAIQKANTAATSKEAFALKA